MIFPNNNGDSTICWWGGKNKLKRQNFELTDNDFSKQ